jgi:hypothetical protein
LHFTNDLTIGNGVILWNLGMRNEKECVGTNFTLGHTLGEAAHFISKGVRLDIVVLVKGDEMAVFHGVACVGVNDGLGILVLEWCMVDCWGSVTGGGKIG